MSVRAAGIGEGSVAASGLWWDTSGFSLEEEGEDQAEDEHRHVEEMLGIASAYG
ncbi:hypothetical protein SMICM17S_09456 [Streptomyces microflavus]